MWAVDHRGGRQRRRVNTDLANRDLLGALDELSQRGRGAGSARPRRGCGAPETDTAGGEQPAPAPAPAQAPAESLARILRAARGKKQCLLFGAVRDQIVQYGSEWGR